MIFMSKRFVSRGTKPTPVDVVPTNSGIVQAVVIVTTGATEVPANNMTNRHTIIAYNASSTPCFLGASNVEIGTGYPLLKFDAIELDLDSSIQLYAIVALGNTEIRVLEI